MTQNFCLSRDSVIHIFRDRIQNGDRLRLTKDELGKLVSGFIEHLRNAKSEEGIKEICADILKLQLQNI
jgi:hypothetical protein